MSIRNLSLLITMSVVYFNATLLNAKEDTSCFIKGNLYANNAEYKKALKWYETGIDTNKTDCIINAAAIYMNEIKDTPYKPDYAASLLQKALKLEPYDSFIHYNLGTYYFNLGVDKSMAQRQESDFKAKYHFLFAHLLGEEDATYYVKGFSTLKRRNGFLDDVLHAKKFDKKLIQTRLEKFSQGKMKDFTLTLTDTKIKFYGRLNFSNAKSYGENIQLIQHALYLDIPDNVASKTEKALNRSKSSFSDGLLMHKFFLNQMQEFVYTVEIVK